MAFEGVPLDSHDVWQTFLAMWFASFDFMFPCFFVLAVWCLQHSYLHVEYHKKKHWINTKHHWWKSNYPKNTYSDSGMSLEEKLCWGKLLHFHFGSADNLRGWPINGRVTFSGSLAEKTSRSLTRDMLPERSQSQWDSTKTPVKMTMMVNHPYNKALFSFNKKLALGEEVLTIKIPHLVFCQISFSARYGWLTKSKGAADDRLENSWVFDLFFLSPLW